MPIRIEGQAQAELFVGGLGAIPDVQSLQELVVVESAGGAFPMLKATLRTDSGDLISRVSEDQPMAVAMGDDDRYTLASGFIKQGHQLAKTGDGYWMLQVRGIHSALEGWSESRAEISAEMSGVERILEVADRIGWGSDSGDLTTSEDRQRWVQYGCPDKVHVNEVWMHCDLPGSFPAMAHTLAQGMHFRLYDIKAELAKDAKWTFSAEGEDGEDSVIPYHMLTAVENRSGVMNALGARGQSMAEYELDTGADALIESGPAGLITGRTDVLDRFDSVSNRRRARSRNVHERYWDAYLHNRTQLSLHSTSTMTLSWRGNFQEVHPLDVCEVVDSDVGGRGQQRTNYSGRYIVSRVARSFRDNTFSTTATMVRETLANA